MGLATAAACGDDSNGGPGTTTTGSGGDGQGGTGATGGGGSGGGALAADGAACTGDGECAGGFCATEVDQGAPSGYCLGVCQLADGDCAGGGVCVDVGNGDGTGTCYDGCGQASDCRDGYDCVDPGFGTMVCFPACTDNAQCPTVGYCDANQGFCIAPELVCDDGADDDGDGATDCEDSDCAATCTPLIDAACTGAIAAQATNNGDTTNGTSLFAGSCTGGGAKEQVYSFTPGVAGEVGTLTITLQSATDQGLYVRTTCGDASTQSACRDVEVGGTDEVLTMVVNGGEAITIFVDAYNPGDEGPYTMNIGFQPAVCGDGTVTLPELCDDGNTDPGDGCAADCTPELDFVCAGAPALQLGANAGDTTTGTAYMSASCTSVNAGAKENIYVFTPPSDGTLSLVLSSATDQGIYALTTCSDPASELGCADANVGGTDETLDVAVTNGVPVYVVVDGYFSAGDAGPYTLTASFTP